jgi:hypothetical protein
MNRIVFRIALVAGSLSLLVAGLASIGARSAPDETAVAAAAAPAASDYLAFERDATTGAAQVAYYRGVGANPSRWGTPDKTVSLKLNNQCIVTNLATDATPTVVDGSVADLLQISITGTNAHGVQLISNGLGSPGTGKRSRSGGRVLANQQMVLKVGTFLPGMGFANAHLNIEAKFGSKLEYALNGGAFTEAANLQNSGDNGPDSGDGDNNLVDIVGPASSLSIRPTLGSGEVALENGGDGPLGRTYFKLAPLVNCGETVTKTDGIGSIGSASFQRLDNKLPGVCTPITLDIDFASGVEVTAGSGEVFDVITIVPGTDPKGVRAKATLIWRVERFGDVAGVKTPRTQDQIGEELEREIQYVDGGPISPITYCEGFNTTGNPVHSALQPWCLLSDTRVLEGDHIVQAIVMDVNGDPKMF